MTYIAHFRESDRKIHELRDHLICVAKQCEKYGSRIGVGKLAYLAGLLHDMGKYGQEFQDYIYSKMPWSEQKNSDVYKVDHGKIGALYLYSTFHASGGSLEKATSEILAMIICYHHGGLEDFIDPELRIPLLERFELHSSDMDYHQCVQRFLEDVCPEEVIQSLFKEACREIGLLLRLFKERSVPLVFFFHLLIKQIYSILIDSDRYDTYLFMEHKEDTPSIDTKQLWNIYISRLNNKLEDLKNQSVTTELGRKIKDLRLQVSETCYHSAQRERGIYLLTVPTGGGKTLSSLRFALEHARLQGMEKIIYILPYTTIIEQNAQVVRDTLDCDDQLLEHHSNVIHTEHGQYKLLTQRWDCPIIFTTVVQFLNTFFEAGTSSMRRLHHLYRAILVFDEIQALPIKCISLFNHTINYLHQVCQCTIVLSSATQPNLTDTGKPVFLSKQPHIIEDALTLFSGFKRMNVVPRFIEGGYTSEMLKDLVLDLSVRENSILIVMNTKQSAEDVFLSLKDAYEENTTLYLLSTNLCPAHRKKIISELRNKLDNHERVICVSTQLIEAGVDISFDTVIRSLAGLDSIAQASGRGNRHGDNTVKETIIVNMRDEGLSKLPEISLGQKYTRLVLQKFQSNPERYCNDLLSPPAIMDYYRNYYQDGEIKKQMDYPIKELGFTLYDMLGTSKRTKNDYSSRYRKAFPFEFTYMFRTAAEQFEVIEDNTRSVLVPYEEGKEIISKLIGNGSLSEKLKHLKQAQQFMVNLYEYQYRSLMDMGALAPSPVDGLTILKDGFYDESLGVTYTKKHEPLTMGFDSFWND